MATTTTTTISNKTNTSIPISLLYEAENMKITVELKSGEIYRGLLVSAEDTMNVSLSQVLRTARNGQVSKLPTVYLRGRSIRFVVLPNLLQQAPVFATVAAQKRKVEAATRMAKQGPKRKRE